MGPLRVFLRIQIFEILCYVGNAEIILCFVKLNDIVLQKNLYNSYEVNHVSELMVYQCVREWQAFKMNGKPRKASTYIC